MGEEVSWPVLLFSVKQNVKYIRRKEQQKESDISKSIEKKLNFDKPFENFIENEFDFPGYSTAKIEIQQ